MSPSVLRIRAQRLLEARRLSAYRSMTQAELARDALVVAPHFDDETLGCGGTLALKADAGATVTIVFLTDGAGSHRDQIDGTQLSKVRRAEAVAAVQTLGLDPDRNIYGNLIDGGLTAQLDAAVDIISSSLVRVRPLDIFTPHRGDAHPDHVAATMATQRAVRAASTPIDIYEYPVWHWQQWPWVGLSSPTKRSKWRPGELHGDAWRRSVGSRFGLRFATSLDRVVDVTGALERKRHALSQYESQMNRLDENWPTLGDVSFGHFLDRLLQHREYFRVNDNYGRGDGS